MKKILYVTNLQLKETSGELTHIVGVINSLIKKTFITNLLTFDKNKDILLHRKIDEKTSFIKSKYIYNDLLSSLFLFLNFYFLNKKDYEYIYIRESFLCILLIPFLIFSNKKVILEVNGIRIFEEKRFFKSLVIKLSKYLTKIMFKKSYKVIAVAEGISEFLKDNYDLKNVYTVHNGTDLKNTNLNYKKENILVFIGNLSKWQNFNLLINSVKKYKKEFIHKKFSVHIYGEGIEKENIYKKVKNEKLEDLIFLKGKIKKEKIIDVLNISKIGLLIDTRFYKKQLLFSPLKYFEYQVAKLPSILLIEDENILNNLNFENLTISNSDNFINNIQKLNTEENSLFIIRDWDLVVDEILDIVNCKCLD